MTVWVHSVAHPDLQPCAMPDSFRTEIAYFMTPRDAPGIPVLGPGEYWIDLAESRTWLEDLIVQVVSPLDAAAKAEIELSEDHERWLEWMVAHEAQHVRLRSDG
ncbi:MAG: hypothetical protein R3E01_23060 [Pirellulaceae bacterium]|nr:hypothetical protein [Planctomycetales bacterium]